MHILYSNQNTCLECHTGIADIRDRNSQMMKEILKVAEKVLCSSYHAGILAFSIIMIGLLSEVLAVFMSNNLETLGLPLALGAFSVALISASPELITAIRAASNNNMQTVVNIAVGASLATVLMTIPAILIVSKIMGMDIDLAITPVQGIMLGLTILAGIIHFNDGETNMLEGFVHLVIFIVFFFLMFV